MERTEVRLVIPAGVDPIGITGSGDALLRVIERQTTGDVVVRGDSISILGTPDEVETLTRLFTHLIKIAQIGQVPDADDVDRLIRQIRADELGVAGPRDDMLPTYRGRAIRPKTAGQRRYIEAIRAATMTFCLGPAGTGKTYLAMAMAVAALKRHEVDRIVLTRPVVEAGENLGFLPGTLQEKIDPYMRPLLDALFDMTDMKQGEELIDQGAIEIAPLAYMRGRTLNDAFVLLDEAQNTTHEQMKMFLTRLGFNSKFVITGDTTQRDLIGRRGGLTDIEAILDGVADVRFVHLGSDDVVRHALVGRIVEAYERYELGSTGSENARAAGEEDAHGSHRFDR